jgi:hypothetical protein
MVVVVLELAVGAVEVGAAAISVELVIVTFVQLQGVRYPSSSFKSMPGTQLALHSPHHWFFS